MPSEPKTTCLCGVHVHSCTKFVASFSIVLAVIVGIVNFPYGLIAIGISISINGLMLYGLRNKSPNYYFPYLILTTVGIFLKCITVPERLIYAARHSKGMEGRETEFIAAGLIMLVVLIIPYTYFFLFVPFYSYKLVVHENFVIKQSQLNPPPPTAPFNAEYP